MKVLFIQPNLTFRITEALGIPSPPLGIAYLASYLRKHTTHELKILDALTLNQPIEETKEVVRRYKPDVVGISALSTPSIYDVYRLASEVKESVPLALTMVGGAHVSFTDEETLKECKDIDIVVREEGEETTKELIECVNEGKNLKEVQGISFHSKDGKIIQNPPRPPIQNLDNVPFPAYDLLPMHLYQIENKPFATIVTSRGCPHSCTFCSSSELFGRVWRARSAENVIEELRLLKEKYNVSNIEFLDDSFTMNTNRVKKISDSIIDECLDIFWACSSRVDVISRFPRVATYLKNAGCHTLYVGAESASQNTLNALKKRITTQQIIRAVDIIKKAGMNVMVSFILGIPGETKEDINKTISFARQLNPNFVQFTICTPYPGTPLYEDATQKGWLLTKDWRKYTVLTPVMKVEGVSPEELVKLIRRAYFKFYTSPSIILKSIRKHNFFVVKKVFVTAFKHLVHK